MIGERIKDLREQNGYTQTTLAKKLGLSRSAVNAWEMGISIPSTQYLVELSTLFHVSTDFILGISKDTEQQLDISFLDKEEKALILSMLNHFRKYHDTIDLLREYKVIQSDDAFSNGNFNMPKEILRTSPKEDK